MNCKLLLRMMLPHVAVVLELGQEYVFSTDIDSMAEVFRISESSLRYL